MKLNLLLLALAFKLKFSALWNPKVKNALKKHCFSINIREKKTGYCRSFSFLYGRVRSGSCPVPDADTEIVWEDADIAFQALKGGDEPMLEALGRSQAVINGNLEHFFAFGDIARL